jgi:NitT/TauT family transport system substrate-binding protein
MPDLLERAATGRIGGWTAALFAALLLSACSAPDTSRATPASPVRVKVLVLPSLSSAPMFVAADGGYFAREGLEIEFVKVTRSTEALLALSGGRLDVWTGSVSFALLNVIGRDAGIRIVADGGFVAPAGCAYGALVARRSLVERREVTGPAGLRGRRVALNPNSSPGYVVESLLGRSGLSLADITVADVPEGAAVAEALASGAIDAAFVWEPWVSRLVQAGTAVVLAPAGEVVPDYQHLVTAYGPSLLKDAPDIGRRFLAAYLRGVAQYAEGKTAANVAIVAKHTGLDGALLRSACWPSVRGDGRVEVRSMIDFQAWGLRRKLLDVELQPDRLWDAAFVARDGRALR